MSTAHPQDSPKIPKAMKIRKMLKPQHKKWIYDTLLAQPDTWHLTKLNPSFEQKFPELGKKYLTQSHIDLQRQKITKKKANEDDSQPEIIAPNGDEKNITNSCTKLVNIKTAIYSASAMIANQGCFLG